MDENQQVDIAKAIKTMRENMPAMLDYFEITGQMRFKEYQAFLRAGFSEQQALELLKK